MTSRRWCWGSHRLDWSSVGGRSDSLESLLSLETSCGQQYNECIPCGRDGGGGGDVLVAAPAAFDGDLEGDGRLCEMQKISTVLKLPNTLLTTKASLAGTRGPDVDVFEAIVSVAALVKEFDPIPVDGALSIGDGV